MWSASVSSLLYWTDQTFVGSHHCKSCSINLACGATCWLAGGERSWGWWFFQHNLWGSQTSSASAGASSRAWRSPWGGPTKPCSDVPSDTSSPAAGRNPPDGCQRTSRFFIYTPNEDARHDWTLGTNWFIWLIGLIPRICNSCGVKQFAGQFSKAYFCGTCDGSDLGVEVGAFWEVFHHDGAGVVQQRLLVDCVFYFWDLFQVCQLKAFGLKTLVGKYQITSWKT